jgi:predicted alpha/beta-fold hydrolase
MPFIETSDYKAPALLYGGHLQTLVPSLFRTINDVSYQREVLDTDDEDFLLLDWSRVGSKKLAIISHGLEGSSSRPYVKGMVRELTKKGWDALAWNFRSCGGKLNKRARLYHAGAIDDLLTVVRHAVHTLKYETISLIGFSLGGSLTLTFLAKHATLFKHHLVAAVGISVPLDLVASSARMAKPQNYLYQKNLLGTLKQKIKAKGGIYSSQMTKEVARTRHFKEFDDVCTAPIHGFDDAQTYYLACSALQFLPAIQLPTLLINAQNDPILSPNCFPYDLARQSPNLYLETPQEGGHLGFLSQSLHHRSWSEERAIHFLENYM